MAGLPERTKWEWAVVVGLAVAGIVVARLAPGFYDKVVVTAAASGFVAMAVWGVWRGRRAREEEAERERFRDGRETEDG